MAVEEMVKDTPAEQLDARVEDEASTARMLTNPFFSSGAKVRRQAVWERLRGGVHGSR